MAKTRPRSWASRDARRQPLFVGVSSPCFIEVPFFRFQRFFLVLSCLKTRAEALNRLWFSDRMNKHASRTARLSALTSS